MFSMNQSKLEHHVTFCGVKEHGINQRGRQAELDVVQYLVENLKISKVGNYRILVGYNVRHDEGSLEVDIVVINKFGVFMLEVKDWRGVIEVSANNDEWLLDRRFSRKNPLNLILFKSKVFYSRFLESKISDKLGNLWDWRGVGCAGFVVLRQGADKSRLFRNVDNPHELIVGLDSQLLLNLNSSSLMPKGSRSRLLSDDEIVQLRELMYGQYESKQNKIIDDYEILGELSPGALFDSFEAVDLYVEGRKVRLKWYKLDSFRNLGEKVEQFKRNAEALHRLGHHPNLVQSIRFFTDRSNDLYYYEITELVKGERLDDWMEKQKLPVSFQQQLSIVEQLCEALECAHGYKNENGENLPIIHRDVNPACIYLSPTGLIKLADFDFSKIFDSPHTAFALNETPFTAPEVLNRSAYPASDIYSLGAVWYWLATIPNHQHVMNLSKSSSSIYQLSIPMMAKELIKRMTELDYRKRPQKILDVKQELQKIKQK